MALQFDQVLRGGRVVLLHGVHEGVRVVVRHGGHGWVLARPVEPVVAVAEVAFTAMHDAVPKRPGGVINPLAQCVAAVQFVDVEP